MENFECPICIERFIDPIECLNCNNNFCRKHIKGFNNVCPLCKKSPFKFRDNIWLSRAISNITFSYKCSLCGFEGNENLFWSHLIEEHKNDIINHFNEKKDEDYNSKNNINNKSINNENKNDKNKNNAKNININQSNNDSSNDKNKSQMKYPDFNQFKGNINMPINHPSVLNSHRVNYSNYPKDNSKDIQNSTKNSLQLSERKKSKLYYCNKDNTTILCNCCPDHICKEGNCLCIKCMKYNTNNLHLTKGELINKSGKIAKLFKGSYYCGTQYETIIENVLGMKFKKQSQCQYPFESCEACKVLTQFKDKYLN